MKFTPHNLLHAVVALLILLSAVSLGAQDRFTLVAPNGIAFSEVRGYEDWRVVAPSFRTDNNEVRVILANDVMIRAYRQGAPGTGGSFPEGSIIVKIGYSAVKSQSFDAALVPGVLKRVEFIIKDSARFPATNGWGYARFVYDPAKKLFTPYGKDANFGQECYGCHTIVKDQDFIFTSYPLR
ncbi:MAG: cytochrome P460 family protein [Spirochaetia bacterium]